jgi:dihydrofolate synthase/folylpolyglutamate synthase
MADYPFLKSLEKFGVNLGLERVDYLLKRLGNPHKKLKCIHVAGTNGKGSTAAMIASILENSGYKVGLYTSPHLFDVTERIQINKKKISKNEFSKGLKQIEKIYQRKKEKPTVFEALTALALWYFAKKKVHYAVLEVGMGGRLDATNVVNPLVTVITNVDFEHVDVLGKSIEKITQEKAGVIKKGIPVITAEDKPHSLKVIKEVCDKKGCLLVGVDHDQQELGSNLAGKHQRLNAACAIAAVRLAQIKLKPKSIERGLKKVHWPGRFQILKKWPLILIDGAHNPAGAKALRAAIQETYPEKYTLIFGCQEGKDFQKVMKELESFAGKIIFTRSSHKFAADPRYLYNHFTRMRVPMEVTYSPKEAVKKWGRKGPLLVSGSLYLVADSLKLLA